MEAQLKTSAQDERVKSLSLLSLRTFNFLLPPNLFDVANSGNDILMRRSNGASVAGDANAFCTANLAGVGKGIHCFRHGFTSHLDLTAAIFKTSHITHPFPNNVQRGTLRGSISRSASTVKTFALTD